MVGRVSLAIHLRLALATAINWDARYWTSFFQLTQDDYYHVNTNANQRL